MNKFMNIQSAKEKLKKNEQLEIEEFYEITEFLIKTNNIKTKEIIDLYKMYIYYLLDNYNGIDPEINDFLISLLKKRSSGYFYYCGDIIDENMFKKITCYEKHEYFLELWFDHESQSQSYMLGGASLGNSIRYILSSLETIEDKEKFCFFLKEKANISMNNDMVGLLCKFKLLDFLKYCLSVYRIETQKGRDIASIIIKTNGIINDSFIYQISKINQFEINIHKYIFDNYKFTENDIDIILGSNNIAMILYIISTLQLNDNYKLNKTCFTLLLKHQKFSDIFNLMVKNKILNFQDMFNIFWSELETQCILASNPNTTIIFEIYRLFVESMNNACNSHLDIFLQKKWYIACDYLINDKKIVTNDMNYFSYVSSNPDINLFEKYFQELTYSVEHLRLACFYQLEEIVKASLNNKIIPTQNCYRALFDQKNLNKPAIVQIVDLLIFGGYNLSYDDILIATKFGVELNKSVFTNNFEPKEDFYDMCSLDFMPEYNDKMYKDPIWLRKWCKFANKGVDFTEIKRFIKKHNLKLDDICKANLLKNNIKNKPKEELLKMCD